VVNVAWNQVSPIFPNGAWQITDREGGGTSAPTRFDAYFRSWDGTQDGPTSSDSVWRITEDVYRDTLTALGVDSTLQFDMPLSILVTGSGSSKTVHVTMNLPQYPVSVAGTLDQYQDALY
jgi:hypothetical protein